MIDLTALLNQTSAYRIIKGDKRSNRLSHAYLILTSDDKMLKEYLKIFALVICCQEDEPCYECRNCNLISKNAHPDVLNYPKKDGAILTEDINSLIEESFLKPIESDKKVFVIANAETMNASAQNKLLKTLEEPPKNVHIVLGATSEFALLPTIKSRVKKLTIPAFDNDLLFKHLKSECEDLDKLRTAINCGDGSVGKALELYQDEQIAKVVDFVKDMLINMQSSKDVLKYSTLITQNKMDISKLLSVLELVLRDMLVYLQGNSELVGTKEMMNELRNAKNFNTGAIIHALDCITEAQKRKKFNMNPTMLIEWLLFQILEGKHKWQKF